MRTFFSSFLALILAFIPLTALAADGTQVAVSLGGDVVVGESARLVIEVTDERGRPSVDHLPEVSFTPASAVSEVTLYHCGDSSVFANCRPNNRAVDGVYEVHFVAKALPATALVQVGEVGQTLSLESGEVEQLAAEEVVGGEGVQEEPAPEVMQPTVKPEEVRVGPGQLTWVVLVPLFLMCSVVSYFVLTTE